MFKEKLAELAITPELAPPLPAYPSVMMSAKRCGVASLLSFPGRLVVAHKAIFRLTVRNELTLFKLRSCKAWI